jgi:hypothetical protein
VKLHRIAKSLIADKIKMFGLFSRILDRSMTAKDSELITYVQEATDFWTRMMLEEHEHDQICINNIHNMKNACQTWFDELLLILEGRVHETLEILKTQQSTLKVLVSEDYAIFDNNLKFQTPLSNFNVDT